MTDTPAQPLRGTGAGENLSRTPWPWLLTRGSSQHPTGGPRAGASRGGAGVGKGLLPVGDCSHSDIPHAPSLLWEVLAHSEANAGGEAGTLTRALSTGASAPLSEELGGKQKRKTSGLKLTTWSHMRTHASSPLCATPWEGTGWPGLARIKHESPLLIFANPHQSMFFPLIVERQWMGGRRRERETFL